MKRVRHWWLLLILAFPNLVSAGEPVDFCKLLQTQAPVKDALTTFVFINAHYHGKSATSVACPRQRSAVDFSIGYGAKAQNFYTVVFRRPGKLTGLREIQATVYYSAEGILVKRIHAYRELTESEATPFSPKFSPDEEAVIRKALGDAASSADAAADR